MCGHRQQFERCERLWCYSEADVESNLSVIPASISVAHGNAVLCNVCYVFCGARILHVVRTKRVCKDDHERIMLTRYVDISILGFRLCSICI